MAGATTVGEQAYGEWQRIMGPDQPVPPYNDPAMATIDSQIQVDDPNDPEKLAKARSDYLHSQVPGLWHPSASLQEDTALFGDNVDAQYLDSPEMVDVAVRSWLRQRGVPVPWTDTDKAVLDPVTFRFKPRVTERDKWLERDMGQTGVVARKEAEVAQAGGQPVTTGEAQPSPTPGATPGATAEPQTVTTGQAAVGTSVVRDNVGDPWTRGRSGGFAQFWANGGSETSGLGPDGYTLSERQSIVAHVDDITNPQKNPQFFYGIGNAYYNSSEEHAREAARHPEQVFIQTEAINHQNTDARMSTYVVPESADLVAYDDTIPVLRQFIRSGADVTATGIAGALGDTITRGQANKAVFDLTANEGYTGVEAQPTPRWQVPENRAITDYHGSRELVSGRVQPIERTRPALPGDYVDAAKPQPGVKLANNLAQVAGIGQPRQRVDAKVPYVQTLGGVRFETPRFIPQRVADIGVAPKATSIATMTPYGTPGAAAKQTTTQQRVEQYVPHAGPGGP